MSNSVNTNDFQPDIIPAPDENCKSMEDVISRFSSRLGDKLEDTGSTMIGSLSSREVYKYVIQLSNLIQDAVRENIEYTASFIKDKDISLYSSIVTWLKDPITKKFLNLYVQKHVDTFESYKPVSKKLDNRNFFTVNNKVRYSLLLDFFEIETFKDVLQISDTLKHTISHGLIDLLAINYNKSPEEMHEEIAHYDTYDRDEELLGARFSLMNDASLMKSYLFEDSIDALKTIREVYSSCSDNLCEIIEKCNLSTEMDRYQNKDFIVQLITELDEVEDLIKTTHNQIVSETNSLKTSEGNFTHYLRNRVSRYVLTTLEKMTGIDRLEFMSLPPAEKSFKKNFLDLFGCESFEIPYVGDCDLEILQWIDIESSLKKKTILLKKKRKILKRDKTKEIKRPPNSLTKIVNIINKEKTFGKKIEHFLETIYPILAGENVSNVSNVRKTVDWKFLRTTSLLSLNANKDHEKNVKDFKKVLKKTLLRINNAKERIEPLIEEE